MDTVKESELIKSKRASYWETASHWFAMIMLFVFPIYMDNTMYYSITKAKWNAFMFLSIAYLGVCLLIAGVIFISKNQRNSRFRNGFQKLTLPQIIILIYFAEACLSAVLSDYGWDCFIGQSRYEGLLSLFLYGGIFFCMSFWGEYSGHYFYAMSAAGIIAGGVGCLQLFNVNLLFDEGYSYYNTGFASTLGNVDCISGIIATMVPVFICAYVLLKGKYRFIFPVGVALMLFLQLNIDVDSGKLGLATAMLIAIPFLVDNKRKALRTAQMLGIVGIVFGLKKMFTMGAVEGLPFSFNIPAAGMIIAGLIVFAAAVFLEKRLEKKLKNAKKGEVSENFRFAPGRIRICIFAIFGVVIAAAFLYIFTYSGDNKLLYDLHEASHLRLADTAGSNRGYIYKVCFKLIAENPVFGVGPGAFMSAYAPYETFSTTTDFAHCDLLQIGVCQGLAGLAVYTAFLVSLIVSALKNAHRFPPIVIIGAGMAGYLMHSFFSFSIAIVTPTFWILAGILDKTVRQLPETAGVKTDGKPNEKKQKVNTKS